MVWTAAAALAAVRPEPGARVGAPVLGGAVWHLARSSVIAFAGIWDTNHNYIPADERLTS